MKTRLTVLTAVVVGILVMSTGPASAVSTLSAGSTSAEGQYTPRDTQKHISDSADSGSGTIPVASVQTVRQVSSSADSLPFTGYLAIPVLLLGIGMVGSGVALRGRGSRRP